METKNTVIISKEDLERYYVGNGHYNLDINEIVSVAEGIDLHLHLDKLFKEAKNAK